MSVVVGKEGRIVLPKRLRDKYGVKEGSRFILRDYGGRIVLIPVRFYDNPTEALHGSVRLEQPIEEPKEIARKRIREKLLEDIK